MNWPVAPQVILLVVKPKDARERSWSGLRPHLDERKIVISVRRRRYRGQHPCEHAGNAPSVFRIMPNLGVELGQGVVAVATETTTTAEVIAPVLSFWHPWAWWSRRRRALRRRHGRVGFVHRLPGRGAGRHGGRGGARRAAAGLGSGVRPPDGSGRRSSAAAASGVGRRHQGPGFVARRGRPSPVWPCSRTAGVRGAFLRAMEEAAERGRAMRDADRPRALE